MLKWEYETLNLDLPLPGRLSPRLLPLGELGWELVSTIKGTHGVTLLFKRPKEEVSTETEEKAAA